MAANTEYWDNLRGKIVSSKGGWFVGKGVYSHGYEMMDDFVGKVSYFQVLILNVTGKLPEKRLADWMEAICIGLSWPDPRIWCNQIGALAGDTKTSPVAATVAGTLAADALMYGTRPIIHGIEFITRALSNAETMTAEELVDAEVKASKGKVHIVGYARPIATGDERVKAMRRTTSELGFEEGEHLKLANKIEEVLINKYDECMNINGYVSAFLSDQGFSPNEVYQIFATAVASGVTACYLDAEKRPEGSFLPLRCDDVVYTGPERRPVPSR